MHTIPNRDRIMQAYAPPEFGTQQQHRVSAVQAVMEYFYKCEELARLVLSFIFKKLMNYFFNFEHLQIG